MTLPRCLLPGHTFEVLRRVRDRRLALLQMHETNELILYCLAYAQRETSIELHAIVVMGSHYHLHGTDPNGELPMLMCLFNVLVGEGVELARGTGGAVLGREVVRSSDDRAPGRHEPAERLRVRQPAGGEPRAAHGRLPGVVDAPRRRGPRSSSRRGQGWFFSKNMPERLTIQFVPPPHFAHLPLDEFRKAQRARLTALEKQHDARRAREGVSVVGAKRLRARRDRNEVAKTPEPIGGLNPRVVGAEGRWREAAKRRKQFWLWHDLALQLWRSGARDVIFPYGTYKMAQLHGAAVEPWPGAAWHEDISTVPRARPLSAPSTKAPSAAPATPSPSRRPPPCAPKSPISPHRGPSRPPRPRLRHPAPPRASKTARLTPDPPQTAT